MTDQQPVDEDRVFVQRSTGVLHVRRVKTITPATPEELEFIKKNHPKSPFDVFDRNGDGRPGGSKPRKSK